MKLPIRFRAFNSGGKGGQNSNRSYNAIEASVTLPDGQEIKATSRVHKSQKQNKKLALNLLKARVARALKVEEERRGTAGWGSVSDRVRTYHEPDNRVVDTAGPRFSYSEVLGSGEIGPVLEARREALQKRSLSDPA